MLLDEFMPEYHFHEVHRTTIRASAKRVLTLTKTLTPGDVPGFRQLAELRGLPARLAGRQGLRFANPRSIFEQALHAGFLLLAEVSFVAVHGRSPYPLLVIRWRPGGAVSPPGNGRRSPQPAESPLQSTE